MHEGLERFCAFVAGASEADGVTAATPPIVLSGGAIQENWSVTLDVGGGPQAGRHDVVVRMDAPSAVAASHSRMREFELLRVAFKAGVMVPEPLWACDDHRVLGRPFFVMRRVGGIAAGHRLVRIDRTPEQARALTVQLAEQLARIHAIRPAAGKLDFLDVPDEAPALAGVRAYRQALDALGDGSPGLEWALRWLELSAPPPGDLVLCHQDFRTGNLMVDDHRLTGVLDWEFAAWGDPTSDIAWLCAHCWRFGRDDRPVGGIGQRGDLYDAYAAATGRRVEPARVRYWEVMAHVRWAVIALQQADRHLSGRETNLELALTGHVVPELVFEAALMTGLDQWPGART
ncbi:MAG: phosphotransferase family protein [Acidobacteria bacterium]|nr:phosphotransferase family protein [Acidobacteriota bacterium]